MNDLIYKRCANHAAREAVARCPSCGRFFCAECVTEHEGRVLCANCLEKTLPEKSRRSSFVSGLVRAVQFLAGVYCLWLAFYYLGRALLSIPSSFHEGSVWKSMVM